MLAGTTAIVWFHQGNKLRFEIGVGLLQSGCTGYTQALHQTVLRRLETAFHAAFGLRRVGPNPHDVQFPKSSSDLRRRQRLALVAWQVRGVTSTFRRRYKQARLVGVIADRPAISLHVAPQQTHVFFRRIVQHEPCVNAAGSVVDHVDQVQLRAAIL